MSKHYKGFSYDWIFCGVSSLREIGYHRGRAFLDCVQAAPPEDEPVEEELECPECEGNGWVHDPSDDGTMTCPECGGSGKG